MALAAFNTHSTEVRGGGGGGGEEIQLAARHMQKPRAAAPLQLACTNWGSISNYQRVASCTRQAAGGSRQRVACGMWQTSAVCLMFRRQQAPKLDQIEKGHSPGRSGGQEAQWVWIGFWP